MTNIKPHNLALHQHLLALGYEHERMPAQAGDDGDAETGPMPWHSPSCDQYTFADEVVWLDANGIAVHEAVPPLDVNKTLTAFEAYLGDNPPGSDVLLEYISESNHAGWDGYTPDQLAAIAFFFRDVMGYAVESRGAAEDAE